MYDGSKLTLIDFGFCKPAGSRDYRTRDSFWRAGSARFAPLGKLNDHTVGKPRHDVFAVGVMAYLLLTGCFPYGDDDDLADLKIRYQTTKPAPVHELNRLVSPEFSRLIGRMLEMNDDKRITSSEALDLLVDLGDHIGDYGTGHIGPFHGRSIRAKRAIYPHVVRDPIAGDIRITELEYRALNTKEMQRLRWIRQLGLTNLVYPGADHSRLSHSIGTVAGAERMLRAIEDESGERVDSQVRMITRLYALTHDVTHIALGHTIEDQLGYFVRHDKNQTRFNRLLDSTTSELGSLLESFSEGKLTKAILNPATSDEFSGSVPYQAVAGDMGADVLDYIDRDAYFCGLDHRVDTAIYRQLAIDGPAYSDTRQIISRMAGKYGIRTDRGYAIDSLLAERYAMFLKVYNHSAKITADAVLDKALRLMSAGRPLPEEKFESFGDESLLDYLIASRKESVQELGKMLKQHRLPRGVFRSRFTEALAGETAPSIDEIRAFLLQEDFLSAAGRTAAEAKIAKLAHLQPSQVFFYVPANPPGHKRVELWISEGADRSKHHPSGDLARRHLNLWELWVFVDSKDLEQRSAVAKAVEDMTGFKNVVDLPGRELRLL